MKLLAAVSPLFGEAPLDGGRWRRRPTTPSCLPRSACSRSRSHFAADTNLTTPEVRSGGVSSDEMKARRGVTRLDRSRHTSARLLNRDFMLGSASGCVPYDRQAELKKPSPATPPRFIDGALCPNPSQSVPSVKPLVYPAAGSTVNRPPVIGRSTSKCRRSRVTMVRVRCRSASTTLEASATPISWPRYFAMIESRRVLTPQLRSRLVPRRLR